MKLIRIKHIVLFAFITLISCGASNLKTQNTNKQLANSKAIIYGQVLHFKTNEPLGFSLVELNKGKFKFVTDETGKYRFDVPQDNYILRCSSLGQETMETKKIKLKEGDSLKKNFL